MSHSVEQHLAVAPQAYDREILRFIPGYEAMLDELVDALAAHWPAGFRGFEDRARRLRP